MLSGTPGPETLRGERSSSAPLAKSRVPANRQFMRSVMHEFEVKTQSRSEMIEITVPVRAAVRASGVHEGLCVVYCPHTTAAITINENADPDVVHDVLLWYDRIVPHRQPGFR